MTTLDHTRMFWDMVVHAAQQTGVDEARLKKLRSAQILRSLSAKSAFSIAATETAAFIQQLQQFVRSQRHDYVQPGRLSNSQKDEIEGQVAALVRASKDSLQGLQKYVNSPGAATQAAASKDAVAHRQGVALILSLKLRAATDTFNLAREQRHQQQLHQDQQQKRKRRRFAPSAQTIGYQDAVNTNTEASNASQQAPAGPQQQLLQSESENRMLRHRLTTQLDQASQIESSLADVAQLTQVFTDQVMHQSEQIELLYDQAVEQTYNVERGNTQLQKAIRLNSSARKYVAVFMFVASLLLLGFDWYAS